jgi:uncharacterized protein YqfB (UPF0267 family)
MPQLQFTRDLADAIRAGRKSQTLRAKLAPGMRVGASLTMLNGYHAGSRVGTAIVTSVELVRRDDLTEREAVLDGFDSLAALHERLDSMSAPDRLWCIRWRDFTPAPAVAQRRDDPATARRTRRRRTVAFLAPSRRASATSPR